MNQCKRARAPPPCENPSAPPDLKIKLPFYFRELQRPLNPWISRHPQSCLAQGNGARGAAAARSPGVQVSVPNGALPFSTQLHLAAIIHLRDRIGRDTHRDAQDVNKLICVPRINMNSIIIL